MARNHFTNHCQRDSPGSRCAVSTTGWSPPALSTCMTMSLVSWAADPDNDCGDWYSKCRLPWRPGNGRACRASVGELIRSRQLPYIVSLYCKSYAGNVRKSIQNGQEHQ